MEEVRDFIAEYSKLNKLDAGQIYLSFLLEDRNYLRKRKYTEVDLKKKSFINKISCVLKVPKCEIFDPFFFTPINPVWVGDLRTGEKKKFFEDYGKYLPFCFFYAG